MKTRIATIHVVACLIAAFAAVDVSARTVYDAGKAFNDAGHNANTFGPWSLLHASGEGMTNTMADMKGVSIWVNFTETEQGVQCEIRSNAHNINPIAVKYGGGGHSKASGATVPDRQTAMAMLADLDEMGADK